MSVERKIALSIIFALIIFSGCAKKEAVKAAPEEDALRQRAAYYWSHKVKGEYDKSYEYEFPLYRNTVSMVEYIQKFKRNIELYDAAVKDIKIEDSEASVVVKVNKKLLTPEFIKTGIGAYDVDIREKWIKHEGAWYHVPQRFR